MKQTAILLAVAVSVAVLCGCGRKQQPAEPAPAPTKPQELFPSPNDLQRAQLEHLNTLLRGPVSSLNLSWAAEMGAVAIPALTKLAGDKTLSVDARDLILIVLGNAAKKARMHEQPDARNDLVVPVLLEAFADAEPRVRRSAAFAARYINDARLVPGLRSLLHEKDFIQEQAVLALGTSGREMEVLPIARLFFETDSGVFRYSCLYALSMMCLLHNVDIAPILRQNAAIFGEPYRHNAESVARRFAEFRELAGLVRQLADADAAQRRAAHIALRQRADVEIPFDADADEQSRADSIQQWHEYLLRGFWIRPPPATAGGTESSSSNP